MSTNYLDFDVNEIPGNNCRSFESEKRKVKSEE